MKVSTQNKVPETPAQLHMAVMAAICGLKDAQPNMILRSVFQAGLDLNNNTVYQDFVKYHADAAFWAMVRQGCGFVEEEPDLGQLAIHLLFNCSDPYHAAGISCRTGRFYFHATSGILL